MYSLHFFLRKKLRAGELVPEPLFTPNSLVIICYWEKKKSLNIEVWELTNYDQKCMQICQVVISKLQAITDLKFSGDDSPLKNSWDEICAQVQFDSSPFWFAYMELMKSFVKEEVARLPVGMKKEIWLQTEDGIDWECEHEWVIENPPYTDDEVTARIVQEYLLVEAGGFINEEIESYLDYAV